MQVNAACVACGATGLYSGMCEGPGRAVICLDCGGTGCQVLHYKPYEGRKRKNGIKVIQQSRGRFIAGPIGGGGNEMTYVEFERRYPPFGSRNDRG
jgi:hypothetical protein